MIFAEFRKILIIEPLSVGRYFYLLLLMFSSLLGISQKPIFINYTVQDGLASSNVYDCFLDHIGVMWFCTETGVSRFDGREFETFTFDDGLVDNEIFRATVDSKNRIWFHSSNGKLCYFKNRKFVNSSVDSTLAELSFTSYIQDIYEDKQGRIWVSSSENGIKCMDTNNNVTIYSDKTGTFNHILGFDEVDGKLIAYKNTVHLIFDKGKFHYESTPDCRGQVFLKNRKNQNAIICEKTITFHRSDEERVELDISCLKVSGKIVSALYDNKKRLWLGTYHDGLILYDPIEKVEQHFFSGMRISKIFQDKEGNIWVCTFEQGVYFLSVNNYLSYTIEDGLSTNFISSVYLKENALYMGIGDGNVQKLDFIKDSISTIPIFSDKNRFINKILVDDNHRIWIGEDKDLIIRELKGDREWSKKVGSCKNLELTYDNEILVSSSHGVYRAVGSDPEKFKAIWDERCYAATKDKRGRYWFGNYHGIYFFDGSDVFPYLKAKELRDIRITDLKYYELYDLLLIGTYGHGLIIKTKNDSIIFINKEKGLLSNFIRTVTIGSDNTFWLSTDRGLSGVKLDTNLNVLKTERYTDADGLISHDVQQADFKGNGAYVATSSGLTYFNIQSGKTDSTQPLNWLKNVQVNGKNLIGSFNHIHLNYDQNNIVFDFAGLHYASAGDMQYKYRLLGQYNGEFMMTKTPELHFPDLPPGKYKLEFNAINKNGLEAKVPLIVNFHIHPHFTQTVGFKLFVALLLSSVIFMIILARIKYIKKANEVQRNLAQLEQKALRTQMNPHFLFNTMSSIQQFINTDDKRLANKYLTKFATLMRSILDNSKKSNVTLNDEIHLLQDYLELEQLRMSNKFDFTITTSVKDSDHVFLLPMMIQPLVENAILHGFATLLERKGYLKIEFSLENDNLKCLVEDNGIGRKRAEQISQKRSLKHESTAIKNIKERINILNMESPNPGSLKIIDLYGHQQESIGTRVVLVIPNLI